MKKRLYIVVAAAFAVVMAFALSACSSSDSTDEGSDDSSVLSGLQLLTGDETSAYYSYGEAIARYDTDSADLEVNVLTSGGSQANVEFLETDETAFAFCQSDVATYAYEGKQLFDGAVFDDFSVVAALYEEQVQIVACDESIQSVADLKGKTVSVGTADSSLYYNALDVLGAYDIGLDDITLEYSDLADSSRSLADGEIDAAFVVDSAPTSAISDLDDPTRFHLVNIDSEHVESLTETSPYYAKATVEAGTYEGQGEDVETVAVLALILANNAIDEDSVYEFTDALFEGAEEQPDACDKYADLNVELASSVTCIPYHPGAAKYFEEQGSDVESRAA